MLQGRPRGLWSYPAGTCTGDVRADVWTLILLFGALVTLASTGLWWQLRRHRAALRTVREAAATEHRRFLRRLDHKLKNLLTAIGVALANLAEGQAQSPAPLGTVERETLRIGRLAAGLRKLVDVEVAVLEEAQVDLANLVREVVAAIEAQGEVHGRTLRLVLPPVPWPLPNVPVIPTCSF